MLLQRVTTEYVELEDRICLKGALEDGSSLVLWLTRRMVERLLPHLLQWLGTQIQGSMDGDLLQSFAQDAARAALTPQSPVVASETSRQSLVAIVDLQHNDQTMVLSFKNQEGSVQGQLALEATPLRQWLEILQTGCAQAGWAMDVWPDWMTQAREEEALPSRLMH